MRRLAASMLVMAMNLVGLQDYRESDVSDDADDDRIECVEFTRDGSRTASRPAPVSQAEGGVAPMLVGWVASSHHQPQLAIALGDLSGSVAMVEAVSRSGEPSRDALALLLSRVLDYADAHGALKAVIESDGITPSAVRAVAEGLGWQFWRYRDHDGATAVEMLRDLYFAPKSDESA